MSTPIKSVVPHREKFFKSPTSALRLDFLVVGAVATELVIAI